MALAYPKEDGETVETHSFCFKYLSFRRCSMGMRASFPKTHWGGQFQKQQLTFANTVFVEFHKGIIPYTLHDRFDKHVQIQPLES